MLSNSTLASLDREAALREVAADYSQVPQSAQEVLAGLRKSPKEISPEWFYDEAGSTLFDMICELPEYYPTRVELQIMRTSGALIADCIGRGAALIEFGSGTSMKTRALLDRLESPSVYVPIDIARTHLLDAVGSIAREYPWLAIAPLCADFTGSIDLPPQAMSAERRIVYFPGSTIGNFKPSAARDLLKSMRELVGRGGAILIGIDLKKNVALLERAYNDSAAVTAKFNLNALRHLNREIGSNFDLGAFEHRATWVESAGRIEMRLQSTRTQRVKIAGQTVAIERGESILTERCYKYSIASFGELAQSAGLDVRRIWCDNDAMFSVQLLEPM